MDGGKVVSRTLPPGFFYFIFLKIPGTHFG
jgi:hypothetical protein